MTSETPDVPHSRENAVAFFRSYIAAQGSLLKGKKVVDLSAGSGYIINEFQKAGASVQLYDLFPEQNTFCSIACQSIDLQKAFPIAKQSADLVILGETIEHLPNQFLLFSEVSRILKTGGIFLLTTPNSSSLRSRLSQFVMESEHYSMPAPNETDAFTRWPGSEEGYFSKLFISGVLRLRTLAALNHLKIKKIHPSKTSSTSRMLLIFYPVIYYFSRKNLKKQLRTDPTHEATHREIFRINTSMNTLLGKHLLMEFIKA